MTRLPNRRLVVAVLAISLVLPVLPFSDDTARAQDTCPLEMRNNPLWITEVAPYETSDPEQNDHTHITDDGAVFVEPGDQVAFDVTVRNRLPDACGGQTDNLADEITLRLNYHDIDYSAISLDGPGPETRETNPCDLREPGDQCTKTVRLPTSLNEKVKPASTHSGEQRIRIMAFDDNARPEHPDNDGWDCAEDTDTDTGFGQPGACAGAERVIVTKNVSGKMMLPDLVLDKQTTGLCVDAELEDCTDQHPMTATTQDSNSFTGFWYNLTNLGTYPNWNPNGLRGSSDYWSNSSFDADRINTSDYGVPEEGEDVTTDPDEDNYDYTQDVGPNCRNAVTPWPWSDDSATPNCSYRAGQILQVDVFHEVERNGEVVEDGVTAKYNPDNLDDYVTIKQDAVLPADHLEHFHKTYKNDTHKILDRYKRAGDFDISLWADQDESGTDDTEIFNVPESDEDNQRDLDVEIKGVDLEIKDPRVAVEVNGKTPANGCTPQSPCQMDGAWIHYDPRYQNAGDDVADQNADLTGPNSDEWLASIYINGQLKDHQNQSHVPKTSDDVSSVFSGRQQIQPLPGGGNQTFEIRLDHPQSYEDQEHWTPVDDPRGRIGERTEGNDCPGDPPYVGSQPSPDNRFCVTFTFIDKNAPEIKEQRIVTESGTSGDPAQVFEGENVTFEADVKDSSLDKVTAFFEYAENGTAANLTGPDGEQFSKLDLEAPDDPEGLTWKKKTQIRGDLTRYKYRVQAKDFNHTVNSSGIDFDLASLPTEVTEEKLLVNDEGDFEEDPPRYEGTADEPENDFNISVNITGTGHSKGDIANNTSVEVVRPNGTTAAWMDVKSIRKCTVDDTTAPNEGPQEREAEACRDADDNDLQEVRTNWTEYFADTTDPDLGSVDLDWAGWFDLVVHVKDKFGRNASSEHDARLADRLNDNDAVAPLLEEASLAPTSVDPGDTIEASLEAYDVLRVENVTLNITKPGPDSPTVQAPLQVEELQDQATLNGSYAASFDVGPDAEYFDRGGTYEVVNLAVEDFAGHFNQTDPVSVVVNDTDHPTITEFKTIPNGTQEAGGPITWIAEIDDQTAVQPPVLRVDRPTSGPTGPKKMKYNETEDRWKLKMTAGEVDVGTWSYDLSVEDYTGKQSTATGEITVAENLAPQDEKWAPDVRGPADGTYGPPQPTIRVDIVDYGQGVNKSSLNFTVDGEEVTDAAEISTVDRCTQCYRLKYTPTEAFEDGSTVDVTVEASDFSEPPRHSGTLRHQFQVDANAPTAQIEMGPSVTRGDQRVIGLPTDIDLSVTDGASGPGETDVTVTSAETDGESQTITIAGGEGTFRLQEFEEVVDGHGSYVVSAEAADAVGNTADPVQRPVLFDKLGPSIEVFAEPGKPREFVFANVTDDAEIQKVVAKYSVDDGAQQTLPLEENNGTWSVRLYNQRTDQAFQEDSTVRFTVEATDVFGNVRSSPETNFTAGDSVPSVDFDQPQEGDTISGETEVTWSASDAETATEDLRISLFYKKPGDTFKEIPGAQDIPNRGSYRLDTTNLPNGDVTLQVFVLDGQNFAADEVNVTVRNLGETFSAPEIQDAENRDGTSVVAPSQETTFRVQIDGDVRRAWANITKDDEVVQTVELENTVGSTWEGSFVAPSDRGNYSVDLAAVTADGVEETSSAYAFAVQGDAAEADNFIPEWTLLTALTATAVALGALGLRSRWT